MKILIGILIPLMGTTLGSFMVYFMKNQMNKKIQNILLGFASGVMIAASIWSLIIPAIDIAEESGIISWLPASIGLILGTLFLLMLDKLMPHLHLNSIKPEGKASNLSKSSMLLLAVTLHNIPEGMAIGVVFSGFLSNNTSITLASAFALSMGIAIQNFPEGAIISMPLKSEGLSKNKSFLYGMLSGVVEPLAAVITIYFTNGIKPILPYILSFAAGAMIYVVVEELIPQSQDNKHSDLATIGLIIGFIIMMILDITLG